MLNRNDSAFQQKLLSNFIFKLSPLFSKKLVQDVSWNLLSIVILGISGLLLNLIIGSCYGAEILGVFNQVFAIYIFASQLGSFGIYFSVLKHVAESSEDHNRCANIIIWGLLITFIFSALVTLSLFYTSNEIGKLLKSESVSKSIIYILPALCCTGLNKSLMAAINGYRHMKIFAVAQSIRYVSIIVFLILCVGYKIKGIALPSVISAVEILLFFFLILYGIKFDFFNIKSTELYWIIKHIKFGSKSFLSGTIAELNTRIDVLMLGYFLSDKKVGIYSMAALIVEGFTMLSYALRDNLNPILAKLISKNQKKELQDLIRSSAKVWYIFISFIGIVSILLYPWFIQTFIKKPEFIYSWVPFGILMAGYILSAGYIPINMILVQAGYPGLHTLLKIAIVLSNIILNAILIPIAGINGAAVATATTFVLSAIYIKVMVRRIIKIVV